MKRLQFSLLLLAFSITLINCKNKTKKQEANETEKTTVSSDSMKNNNTTVIDSLSVLLDSKSKSTAKGNVVFRQRSNTVSMTAVFTGLEEGIHAVHLHVGLVVLGLLLVNEGGRKLMVVEGTGEMSSTRAPTNDRTL